MRTIPSTSQKRNDELSWSLIRLVSPTGTTKNRPTASARATTTVPTHMPPEISFSSSGSWALAEMPSALKPMTSDSTSATTPRMIGRRSSAVLLEHRVERERGDLDLAVGPALGVDAVLGDLLGQRLAHGDRPRRDAAHHHALEHGLTADGGVALGDELPRRAGAAWRTWSAAYERAPRLAARRLKRSTRPPVSTSFWRPV